MRRLNVTLTAVAVLVSLLAPAALAAPSEEKFEANDAAWQCEGDGFVENHCVAVNAQGKVLNIKVFDSRGPQESASSDLKADSRPCPHDAGGGSDPNAGDGTWWDYLYGQEGGPLFVCHHSGQQQFLP